MAMMPEKPLLHVTQNGIPAEIRQNGDVRGQVSQIVEDVPLKDLDHKKKRRLEAIMSGSSRSCHGTSRSGAGRSNSQEVLDQAIGFEFPRSSGTENTSDNNSRSSTASLSTSPQLENQVHHLNSSLIPPSLSSSTPRKEAKRKAARSARKQSAPKRRRQNGPGSARKSATGVLGEKVSRAASTPSKTIPEYLPPKSSLSGIDDAKRKLSLEEKELALGQRARELDIREQKLQKQTVLEEKKTQHYRNELSESEKKCTELKKSFQEYQEKVCENLVDVLRKLAEAERREREAKLLRDSLNVGRVIARSEGHMIVDVWEEGEMFKQLRQRQGSLQRRKDKLDKERKLLSRRKAQNAKLKAEEEKQQEGQGLLFDGFRTPRAPSPACAFDETAVQDDIYKLNAVMIKREGQELGHEESQLENKKKLHIAFCKLMRDESASRFQNNPVLNQRYLLIHLLGKGGFSEVWKAYDLSRHAYVACKIHQLNPSWPDDRKRNYTKHATREYEIHKALNHPRIVRLFDVFGINLDSFCTVMDFCDGDDLDRYLKIHGCLSEKEAKVIITQVFSGLKYLNEQKRRVIHYDLKPANILFDGSEVKITDFGLSKIMDVDTPDSMELTSQGAGTYWYLPPETFTNPSAGPAMISPKVDVWSAGVIFYQMLFGQRPFGHNQSQETILSAHTIAQANGVEFLTNIKVSAETKDFISHCLSRNPHERPSALEIWNNPYFQRKK
eukprot:1006716_1